MEEMQAEDQRKAATAVSNLLEEIESKYAETSISLTKVMSQQAAIHQDFTEEITRIQGQARYHFEKILLEHQRITMQLEAQKKELEEREKELEKREEEMEKREKAHNESEKRKIYYDKEMALDLKIEFLKGALQITTHMEENRDMKITMEKKKEELEEKVIELESLEALNEVLVVREQKISDELQEVRKELISYFKHRSTCASIGVKLMGDLEIKPFYQALKRKYSGDEAYEKALEFCSLWEKNLKDPSWYPFKVITVGGNVKEIIDEEDERLKGLRNEHGGVVYKAVTDALKEMNEYNPTGGYCVSELWNFKEGRKATLTEGVKQILKEWGLFKRKRM